MHRVFPKVGCNVLQIVSISERQQSQRRNRHSFPRTEGSEQTHSVGLSQTSGLFELWLHGICNSRSRPTTASGRRYGSSMTQREIWCLQLSETRASEAPVKSWPANLLPTNCSPRRTTSTAVSSSLPASILTTYPAAPALKAA